jgi:hypothetical protein
MTTLTIWLHRRPQEYFCEGCQSGELSDLARQLKVFGYSDSTHIQVRDAASEKIVSVRMKDRRTGQRFAVTTIGQARTGKANAPLDDWQRPRPGFSGNWMGN